MAWRWSGESTTAGMRNGHRAFASANAIRKAGRALSVARIGARPAVTSVKK